MPAGTSPPEENPRAVVVGERRGGRRRNRLLAAVLAMLVLYAFVLAKTLIVPMLLGVLLSLLLAPAVRRLQRWHVPRPLSALLVLSAALAVVIGAVVVLAGPAQTFLARAPESLQRIEQAISEWRKPIVDASRRASQSLERITQLERDVAQVPSANHEPGLLRRLLATMPAVVAGFVVVIFLTFLLLVYGDAILRKAVSMLPRFRERRRVVETTRRTQNELSAYVGTMTLINIGLGLAVAAAMAMLGLEDPWLWGGMAALLNFAPYVGPTINAILLTLAGFGQFAESWQALTVPAVFILIQMLESELITPLVLGRRLALDPVMVFLSLLILGWLWGVIGVLIAVPVLTGVRICAEQVPGWQPLARLLGPAKIARTRRSSLQRPR